MGSKANSEKTVQMFDNLIKGHNDCLKLQESIYQKPIADLLEGFLISLDRYDEVESENAQSKPSDINELV